jgi:hypothetical protein
MIVLLLVIGFVLLGLVGALIIGIATSHGPGATEVALGYENAWDQLDFISIWNLSAAELRDGLPKKEFVAAKAAAYRGQPVHQLAASIHPERMEASGDFATVATRLTLHDGGEVHNLVYLARREGVWRVTAYGIDEDAPVSP